MITSELLAQIFPDTPKRLRDRFLPAFNKFCPQYGIDNYLRICAFLATGGVETDFLKVLSEYASGADYEGRRDLGNTQGGDGVKFRGRGFFQTTGRFNYKRLNETTLKKLGIDFLIHPEKLTDIDIAVESACIFWRDNNLSKYADTGDFKNFSSVVNCGKPNRQPNQWAKRNALYSLCKRRVPLDFSFAASNDVFPSPVTADEDRIPAPSGPQPEGEPSAAPASESEPSKVKEFSDKYLKHCPQDTARNIAAVVAARAAGVITPIWYLGLHGQILLISVAVIFAGFSAYALYRYSPRIIGWAKDIADPLIGND